MLVFPCPGTPDISTAFLASPEQARKAIQLAVRLCKRRGQSSPPGPEGDMNRGTGGESLGAGGHRSMQDRLQRLALLVQRGTLTASEGDRLRVKVRLPLTGFCYYYATDNESQHFLNLRFMK